MSLVTSERKRKLKGASHQVETSVRLDLAVHSVTWSNYRDVRGSHFISHTIPHAEERSHYRDQPILPPIKHSSSINTRSLYELQHLLEYLQPPIMKVNIMSYIWNRDSLGLGRIPVRIKHVQRISRDISSPSQTIPLTVEEILLPVQYQHRLTEIRRQINAPKRQRLANRISLPRFKHPSKNCRQISNHDMKRLFERISYSSPQNADNKKTQTAAPAPPAPA